MNEIHGRICEPWLTCVEHPREPSVHRFLRYGQLLVQGAVWGYQAIYQCGICGETRRWGLVAAARSSRDDGSEATPADVALRLVGERCTTAGTATAVTPMMLAPGDVITEFDGRKVFYKCDQEFVGRTRRRAGR